MAEIVFEHVTKRFGGVVALNDFNLSIQDKEFVTLVGPSGCGKSTTLNILAGLEDPTEGLVKIDGKTVNDMPSGKRDIAMVFQSYALYPHMTVHENIGFGLRVRGLSKEEIDRRVKEASQILGIEKFLDRKPGELSGGQRQRVALGRAITREPKVFLLDEPLSNLDAKLRTQMRADLKLLFNRLGGTVVYVTHDQLEAMTLSDRVVVMKDGFIQQVGHPLKLYDDPDNMFVAGFMGNPTMNFVNCDAGCEIGGLVLRTEHVVWPLDLPTNTPNGAFTGKNVILGIRPEDMVVALPGELDPEKSIPCAIEVVESMGSQNIIYVNVEGTRLVITMETDFNGRSGDTAFLSINSGKVHLFDPSTEKKIRLE